MTATKTERNRFDVSDTSGRGEFSTKRVVENGEFSIAISRPQSNYDPPRLHPSTSRMNPLPTGPVSPDAGAGCAPVPRTRDGRGCSRRLQSRGRPWVSTKSEPETPPCKKACMVKAVRVPSWLCCTPHTATVDCLDVPRYALSGYGQAAAPGYSAPGQAHHARQPPRIVSHPAECGVHDIVATVPFHVPFRAA